jgi:hypothetical protein
MKKKREQEEEKKSVMKGNIDLLMDIGCITTNRLSI